MRLLLHNYKVTPVLFEKKTRQIRSGAFCVCVIQSSPNYVA